MSRNTDDGEAQRTRRERQLDEALLELRRRIAAEEAPERLVELARQLEAAARRREEGEPGG